MTKNKQRPTMASEEEKGARKLGEVDVRRKGERWEDWLDKKAAAGEGAKVQAARASGKGKVEKRLELEQSRKEESAGKCNRPYGSCDKWQE